jgi:hypothetical protein
METDACRGVLVNFYNSLANEAELKSVGLNWYLAAGAVAAERNPSTHYLLTYLPQSLASSIVIVILF